MFDVQCSQLLNRYQYMPPLVSICLPNLNHRAFLDARMESLLAQTLSDWELIVCDGFSDDGSWEFLQTFAKDRRAQLFQAPREGIYAGWNACLRRAEGRYIAIAPADDTARPEFLETMTAALEAHPDVNLAVCQFDFIDRQGRVFDPPPKRRFDLLYQEWLAVPHRRPREADILTHLCVGIPWTTTSALVFRASLLEKTGFFRTDCGARADALWSLKASLHSDSISLPGRMATWRRHVAQGSAENAGDWWRRSWRLMRELLQQNHALIPEAWRRDPEWERELLAVQRTRYLRNLRLDRNAAKRHFGRFVLNCAQALAIEPRYAARRLLRGLPWEDSEIKEEYTHLRYLIDKWKVAWEPGVVATPKDRTAQAGCG